MSAYEQGWEDFKQGRDANPFESEQERADWMEGRRASSFSTTSQEIRVDSPARH